MEFQARHGRAILGDDMGLGKTRQAIIAIKEAARGGVFLVICPASLKLNWAHEIRVVDPAARIEVLSIAGHEHPQPRRVIVNWGWGRELCGTWMSRNARSEGDAMTTQESKLVEQIKADLLSRVEEWLGSDIPDEGTDDYDTWQSKLEEIEAIESVSDVIEYAESSLSDSEEFLQEWAIARGMKMPRISRKSAEVVLFSGEYQTMLDSWTDELVVRRDRRANFSVIGRKYCGAPPTGARGWQTWGKVSEIRTPRHLQREIREQSEALGIDVELSDVIGHVAVLDWITAAVIAHAEALELPKLPTIETLLEQRSLRALGKVEITVEWGYELQSVIMPFDRWMRVLSGEIVEIRSPYWYEGRRFMSWWCFEKGTELCVRIDPDGYGVGADRKLTTCAD
ncbi:MAG: hypothetical protein K2W80_00400 [Burkholderiales bacterium]|nr:hypothetical protein [Burkholderiales bacterium]